MSERLVLAEDFVRSNRATAIRTLENLTPEAAAAFVERVPNDLSVDVLAGMQPYYAAKSLKFLPNDSQVLYLGAISARGAAAILRHIEEIERTALLDAMPAHIALRIRRVLAYRQSLVGAWMDPLVLTVPVDCLVGEAKSRLLQEEYENHYHTYLLDAEQKICGVVQIARLLLQSDLSLAVSDLMEPVDDLLHASETLAAASGHAGWEKIAELPVVDRDGKFVGAMRLIDLRAALERPEPSAQLRESSASFMGLAEICYLGLADLMSASLSDSAPPASRVKGGG